MPLRNSSTGRALSPLPASSLVLTSHDSSAYDSVTVPHLWKIIYKEPGTSSDGQYYLRAVPCNKKSKSPTTAPSPDHQDVIYLSQMMTSYSLNNKLGWITATSSLGTIQIGHITDEIVQFKLLSTTIQLWQWNYYWVKLCNINNIWIYDVKCISIILNI